MVFSLVTFLALAATVDDPVRGFSFETPTGYSRAEAAPPMLYLFTRGTQGGPDFAAITIAELGGSLSQDTKLIPSVVEASAREAAAKSGIAMTHFEYAKTSWRGFTLDLMISTADANGLHFVTLATQVPLKKSALQVQALGPASKQPRLTTELTTLLGSLNGESSWLTEAQRDRKLGEQVGTVTGYAMGAGIALLGTWWLRRRRKRVSSSG